MERPYGRGDDGRAAEAENLHAEAVTDVAANTAVRNIAPKPEDAVESMATVGQRYTASGTQGAGFEGNKKEEGAGGSTCTHNFAGSLVSRERGLLDTMGLPSDPELGT